MIIEGVQDHLSELSPELVEKQYAIEATLESKAKIREAIAEQMDLLLIEEKNLNFQLEEGVRVQEFAH
jgi:hypothetical protein